MHLDHLSYAAGPEGLGAAVQRLGKLLGAPFIDGGLHPRFGTRNFTLPLANGSYLEVVQHLDHPSSDKAIFGQAVQQRTDNGGGWFAWVISVPDLAPFEEKLGRTAVAGHRQRPDGVDLYWRQLGVLSTMEDPLQPFFISWDSAPELHPSADGHVKILAVEYSGDAERFEKAVTVLDGIELVKVAPAEGTERGIVAVHFETERGVVRID